MNDSSSGQKLEGESSRSGLLREHGELILLGLIVLVIVGVQRLPIATRSTEEVNVSGNPVVVPEKNNLKELEEQSRTRDREIMEIKNSLKAREFRGLSKAVPLGGGKLRIVVPADDEGNPTVAPLELRDALLQEAERLKRDPSPAPDPNHFTLPTPIGSRLPPAKNSR